MASGGKNHLRQRRAERGDAERSAALGFECARCSGCLHMHHQALPCQSQQIECRKKGGRPRSRGGDKTGQSERQNHGRAEVNKPNVVDPMTDQNQSGRRKERGGKVERTDLGHPDPEGCRDGGDKQADNVGLAGRRIEGMQRTKKERPSIAPGKIYQRHGLKIPRGAVEL